MTEILLRVTVDQYGSGGPTDLAARAMEALAPLGLTVDPAPVSLGALAILGWVVYALDQRRDPAGGRRAGPGGLARRRGGQDAMVAEQSAA